MNHGRALVILCLTSILLACGQKGPLVLPDAAHPHKRQGDRARDGRKSLPAPAAPVEPAPAQPGAAAAPAADPTTHRQP